MSAFRRHPRLRTLVSLFTMGVMLLWGLPACAVSIVSPKPNSTVRGTVTVTAAPDEGEAFTYAVLVVDSERRSVTNEQPLRFELDTTKLPNGPHQVQVDLADLAGLLASSKRIKVLVANPVYGGVYSNLAKPANGGAYSNLPKPVKHAINPIRPATPPAVTAPPVTAAPPVTTTPPAVTTVPAPAPEVKAGSDFTPPAEPPTYVVQPHPVRGSELAVVLNGQTLHFAVPPQIEQGRAMVLLRPLAEAIGATLAWDAAKKQAIVTMNDRTFTFTVGDNAVLVDGQLQAIGRTIAIASGRTVVPITVWRDLFGGTVAYDGALGSITLYRQLNLTPLPQIAAAD